MCPYHTTIPLTPPLSTCSKHVQTNTTRLRTRQFIVYGSFHNVPKHVKRVKLVHFVSNDSSRYIFMFLLHPVEKRSPPLSTNIHRFKFFKWKSLQRVTFINRLEHPDDLCLPPSCTYIWLRCTWDPEAVPLPLHIKTLRLDSTISQKNLSSLHAGLKIIWTYGQDSQIR